MKAGYHSLVPVPLFSLKQQRNLAKIFETSIKKGSRKPPLLPHNVPDYASTSNRSPPVSGVFHFFLKCQKVASPQFPKPLKLPLSG